MPGFTPLVKALGSFLLDTETPQEIKRRKEKELLQKTWNDIAQLRFKQTYFLNKMESPGFTSQSLPKFSSADEISLAEYAPQYLRRDDYLAFKMQTSVDKYFPTMNDKLQAFTTFVSLAFPLATVGKIAGVSNAALSIAMASGKKDYAEGLLGLLPYGKVSKTGLKTFFYFADKAFDVTDLIPAHVKKNYDL